MALLILIAGLAGVLWGSDLMVKGAVGVAQQAGISQAVIALSIVAIGTVPAGAVYFAFCFIARARKPRNRQYYRQQYFQYPLDTWCRGQHGSPDVSAEIANRDVWVMLGVAILGLVLMRSARRMSRIEGLFSLVLYALYVGYLYFS